MLLMYLARFKFIKISPLALKGAELFFQLWENHILTYYSAISYEFLPLFSVRGRMLSAPSPGMKCSASLFICFFSLFSCLRQLWSYKNRKPTAGTFQFGLSIGVLSGNKPTQNATCGMNLFHLTYYGVFGNLYDIIITWLTVYALNVTVV
jgi:hypothetical protein